MAKHYDDGTFCPFVGGECKKHECKMYVHVVGMDPQTGTPIDHWECSLAILPTLLVEGIKEARHGAAATESFRNEVVRGVKEAQIRQLRLNAERDPDPARLTYGEAE